MRTWFSSGMPQAHKPRAAQNTSKEIRDFAGRPIVSDEHIEGTLLWLFRTDLTAGMFTVVGTGWILPIFSTYLDLSYLVRSMMPDFDVGCVALWSLWLTHSVSSPSPNLYEWS